MPAIGNALGLPYRKNGLGFVGALDAYTTGLAGLWSVSRRLLTSYNGSLIRVRRSSDNAEQDIGATASGNLDTAALAAFVGSNSAFVRSVYDQSGNANPFQQTTAASQPRIVNAGTLDMDDGATPALRLLGSQFLQASRFTGTAMSLYVRQKVLTDPPTDLGAIVSGIGADSAGANQDHFPWANSEIYVSYGSTSRKSCGNPTQSLTDPHSFTCVSATNNWQLRINGTAFYSTATNTVGFTTAGTGGQPWIGKASSAFANGWFTEMAFYNVAHSSTEWAGIEPVFQP